MQMKQIFFSNLQLWQLVTLQPFHIERPKVSLLNDLDPFLNVGFTQETGNILKIGFVLSKFPHLQRPY